MSKQIGGRIDGLRVFRHPIQEEVNICKSMVRAGGLALAVALGGFPALAVCADAASSLVGDYAGSYSNKWGTGVLKLKLTAIQGETVAGSSVAEFSAPTAPNPCINTKRPVTGTLRNEHLDITIVPAEKICEGRVLSLEVKGNEPVGEFKTGYDAPSAVVLKRK